MANEKRLIDANALIAYFEEQYNVAMDDPGPVSGYVMSALRCCIEHFKTIPTVDAVEVVRCKDCLEYEPGALGRCKFTGRQVNENFFCAWGERKDNG